MEQIALNKNNERVRRLRARRRSGIVALVSIEITEDIPKALQKIGMCCLPATRQQVGQAISRILQQWAVDTNNRITS